MNNGADLVKTLNFLVNQLQSETFELKIDMIALKDEQAKDLADMRRFQALYIEADQKLRIAIKALKSIARLDCLKDGTPIIPYLGDAGLALKTLYLIDGETAENKDT